MATVKITDLTAYSDPKSTDVLPIVDVTNDITKKVDIAGILKNAPAGSASATAFAFDGDPNTGIYSPGADQIALATDGTGRVFVDASGNVGIGTSSPGYKLHTAGAGSVIVASQGTTDASFLTNLNGTQSLYIHSVADLSEINELRNVPIRFNTNATERLRIDSSGRLLVGTSSARSSGAAIQIESLGNDKPVLEVISDYTSTASAGAAFLLLTRAGATSLGSVTSVSADNELGSIRIKGYDGTNPITAAEIKGVVDGTPGTNNMPGRLVFSTTADGASSPTERMRIGNDGTSRIFASNYGLLIGNAQAAGSTYTLFEGYNSATSTTALGNISIQIFNNGNVRNTNNSYAALSDIKLKENIVDATSQWNDIKALRVRKYNFKEGQTHTQIGLIAQEVELVSPGLVTESPDRDSDGNDLGTTTKSVNYSVLYMKAVKALQEAIHRIESLEATVATLTA